MKTKHLFAAFAALLCSCAIAHAADKTVGEKSAEAWDKTKATTKEAAHTVAKKTKEAVTAVEDAIEKPDADARKVKVRITDRGIQMPGNLPAGKTAFIVTNAGKEKHNFEISGEGLDKSFWLAIAPKARKTLQVQLKPGSYTAVCKLHEGKEPKVTLTVK